MGSAFGIWNKQPTEMWLILRSSDETCAILKLAPHEHKVIRFAQDEIVSAFVHASREEAEATIGAGEREKFSEYHESEKR